jgi:hypothetical protein
MTTESPPQGVAAAAHPLRLRLGIVLWLLSWVPYGLILGMAGAWLTAAWTFEILLGLVGLALAGAEFAGAVKECGWKGAPKVAWHALLHGHQATANESAPAT